LLFLIGQVRALREDQLRTFNSLTDANFELQQLRAEHAALQAEAAEAAGRLEAGLLDARERLRAAEEEKGRMALPPPTPPTGSRACAPTPTVIGSRTLACSRASRNLMTA
jgi:hypothetical protein